MYSMKQVCEMTGLSYETLRFYCNEGLIPNVRRASNNYRQFDDRDVAWLRGLLLLRKCGMGLADMKAYMNLCLQGKRSIPERQQMLTRQEALLRDRMAELQACMDFIRNKQRYYRQVLDGEVPYTSNLIDPAEE